MPAGCSFLPAADRLRSASPVPSRAPQVKYPIIADTDRSIAVQLGMLDEEEKDNAGIPATVRKVFIIGPDRKIRLVLVYPTAVGRNFAEILRVIDGLQLAAKFPIATPVNWTPGADVSSRTKLDGGSTIAAACATWPSASPCPFPLSLV